MTVKLTVINTAVSDQGIFIAGGSFGAPGNNLMADDGVGADESAHDGVYTIQVKVPANTHQYYTFSNGANPNYSGKEDIAGKAYVVAYAPPGPLH